MLRSSSFRSPVKGFSFSSRSQSRGVSEMGRTADAVMDAEVGRRLLHVDTTKASFEGAGLQNLENCYLSIKLQDSHGRDIKSEKVRGEKVNREQGGVPEVRTSVLQRLLIDDHLYSLLDQ